ncbi:hypothetical protein AB0M86_42085, partial [Streptomyces sp. NPDC051639]|uniref:hypothetical protein n=1 Tax=Streptomyces sp. NPDC051639 TaxID=3155671 RepID=UPI0034448708
MVARETGENPSTGTACPTNDSTASPAEECGRTAESQQFLFHALIQRAGNRYGAPMFVGTSNA